MRNLKDGIRSLVKIDFYGHVHKYFRGTDADKRCATEVKVLQALEQRGCDYVPKLIDYKLEENYLVTTNCGSPAPNIPRKKSYSLSEKLATEYGVQHDDPEPRNVTYDPKEGQFCIIDFELATLLADPKDSSTD